MSTDYTTPDGVMKRLKRIETKLTLGFEELGVVTDGDPDWLSVQGGTVFVSTLTRSVKAILDEAARRGAKVGHGDYELVHGGKVIAWL